MPKGIRSHRNAPWITAGIVNCEKRDMRDGRLFIKIY
jgi:hypothetical protein